MPENAGSIGAAGGDSGARPRWVALHSVNVRICHWINVVAGAYLLLSGIHIFLDFPELYWGHTGYQGYPAIFRLADWGISWDEAGAMGDRRWGRNYHFTFAWVFLVNGLVYFGWNLATGRFRERLVPAGTSSPPLTSGVTSARTCPGACARATPPPATACCRRSPIFFCSSSTCP